MSRRNFHQTFYLLGTIAVAVAIPLSHFLMGLACFLLSLNWLAEWNWREKQRFFRKNRQGIWFAAFYVVYAIGLVNVTDWSAAGKEMLNKLPFLLGPIVVITSKPFNSRQLQSIFGSFILATLIGCIWNFIYAQTHDLGNIREMSCFIDHIRFSLCVVMSIVFCIHYWIHTTSRSIPQTYIYPIISVLLLLYLLYSQTLSGIVILIVITICYVLYLVVNQNDIRIKRTLLGLMGTFLIALITYTVYITYDYFHVKDSEPNAAAVTASGNPYSFEENPMAESGHYIGNYVCEKELQAAWTMRSDSVFDELTAATLIRYLNSMGLRKDSAAVMQLGEDDIRNVEHKVANIYYVRKGSLRRALYETFFGITSYRKYGTIVRSSLLERVELWRASWHIVQDHWMFGVGIGQQRPALDRQLEIQNSPIAERKMRGSHNQFLTFWVAAGIIPVIFFCFLLVFPFVTLKKRITFVYFSFILLLFLSMLVEDTLNAQTGRMMFAFFVPILLFNKEYL